MKLKLMIIASLLLGIYVSGCARNNANDNVALRSRDANEPTRVNYNPRDNGPADTNPNVTDVRYNNQNANLARNSQSRMVVADAAADRVSALKEVDTANVIVTNNNAYVAAKLAKNAGTKLTQKLKHKISNRVKSVDPKIKNVYVSVNPDFYHRMTNYANDLRTGKPVSGLFNEFNTTVQRIFPNQK